MRRKHAPRDYRSPSERGPYARVSTGDQSLDGQCQRLSTAGCDKLFEEKISGATRNRPQLEKLIEHLRKDDILVVTRLDRLARSTSDLFRIAERLTEKGAGLQSLDEPWGNRGKTTGTAAFFSCTDSASWTLCIMCRRRPPFPR